MNTRSNVIGVPRHIREHRPFHLSVKLTPIRLKVRVRTAYIHLPRDMHNSFHDHDPNALSRLVVCAPAQDLRARVFSLSWFHIPTTLCGCGVLICVRCLVL